ncbi:hypothetical protein Godav_018848 [Gossypium davidsonii]|uniref:Uncharacterized protein n=2 Tax=Gossypium TaxID=3633 RepID=A0A7J8QYJ2_GOSDV|nr:hypothetical protein [Gossypium davidsonii]MBA0606375.1 hypothetical protein [Gossypium davidsonii]MBA0641333.1 hypothetical protein [Gossypium klotzschianum]MBA0641334.1 hypothetical protein [Gossypium klotzschianum]
MECFLCHGLYRLRKCLKKSVIEGMMEQTRSPRRLVRAREKSKLKGKEEKKKRVKCFLFYGSHKLRNCPKQAVVKGKAMSELGESSERLPPKEVVSLSLNLGEKVAMKIVKLGPMRLNSSEASELA